MTPFVWIRSLWILGTVLGFQAVHLNHRRGHLRVAFSATVPRMTTDKDAERELRDEAEKLLAKARQLRLEIGATDDKRESTDVVVSTVSTSGPVANPWLVETDDKGEGYRLYIDIGREDGTWMEPRWGASGRRIRFTLDVKFLAELACDEAAAKMVKDNYMGKSSKVCVVATATEARLRDGFDRMSCHGGCYRIDSAGGKETVRFFVEVDGTTSDQAFGDVSIPAGRLYFSLPCFGGSMRHLSTKEGVVTVRQNGWNTGWRREESRIVGTFHASPIETARKRDSF